MKALLILLLAFSTARADGKAAVDKLVRAHLDAIARGNVLADDAATKTLAKDAWLISTKGAHVKTLDQIDLFPQDVRDTGIDKKIESVRVTMVGTDAAWFHAVVTATLAWRKGDPTKPLFRISGIAVDDHGWKLAAVMYSKALSDKELLAGANADPTTERDVERNKMTSNLIDMFPDQIAVWHLPGAMASGTSPAEIATTDKAVDKLVESWDKLHITLRSLDMRGFGSGGIAFSLAEVRMPAKKKGTSVPLVLGAIWTPVDDKWQWVDLNFGTPVVNPY